MQADRAKIERLLKTAGGQINGVLKMIEEDQYCIDISNQIMAAEAILRKANREILCAHLKSCVRNALLKGDAADGQEKLEELIKVMDKLAR